MKNDNITAINVANKLYDDNKNIMQFEEDNELFNKCRYYEKGGYFVPRVTVLLDTIKEDYLLKWANSLGWRRKDYNKTLQEYADLGTTVHREIDEYLNNGKQGCTAGLYSFEEWWEKLISINKVSDIETEVSMVGPYFCGTTDLYFKANGMNCLVDFKTSKNIGYKYMMQLAAYSYLMETQMNRKIDYCIIFQVDKNIPGIYQAYRYNLNDPEMKNIFSQAIQYMFHLSCCFMYNIQMRQSFNNTLNNVKVKEAIKII